jgi:hypothetical protein
VEPWRVGTRTGPAPVGGDAADTGGRLARSPRRGRVWLCAAALAVIGVVWSVAGRGSGDGGGGGPDGGDPDGEELSEIRERTDEERARDVVADDRADAARRTFAQASRRLELGGSYTYSGTVHAPAPSDARPAHAPAPDVTVEGEVLWPLRTHEIAVDATGRAAETVTIGPTIWQRRAPTREGLAATAYEFAGDVTTWNGAVVPFGAGAARLPGWLTATTDRVRRSEIDGRRTFAATLPADRLGDTGTGPPRVDGEMVLVVDLDRNPLHIEVTVPGEAATGSAWRVSLDLGGIGDTVAIDVPNGELPSVTVGPSLADVQAAGIAAPVELAQLPEGWILTAIALDTDEGRADCARLRLDYNNVESGGRTPDWLALSVLPPMCAVRVATEGTPLEAGAFIGWPATFPGGEGAVLSDGRTTVEYVSSLPSADALRLFETVEPYDPATRPSVLTAP